MQLVIFLPDLLNRLQLRRGNPTGLQVVALLDPVFHKETQILPLLDLTAAVAGILQQLLHSPSVTAVVRCYRCLGQATNSVINRHQPVLARSAASLDLNTILVLHFKTKIKIIYNVNNSLFVFRHCKIRGIFSPDNENFPTCPKSRFTIGCLSQISSYCCLLYRLKALRNCLAMFFLRSSSK